MQKKHAVSANLSARSFAEEERTNLLVFPVAVNSYFYTPESTAFTFSSVQQRGTAEENIANIGMTFFPPPYPRPLFVTETQILRYAASRKNREMSTAPAWRPRLLSPGSCCTAAPNRKSRRYVCRITKGRLLVGLGNHQAGHDLPRVDAGFKKHQTAMHGKDTHHSKPPDNLNTSARADIDIYLPSRGV